MAYTPVIINTNDEITAAWGNKVETNLARIGNYRGVVAAAANLPDVATLDEGDWYWCKSERVAKIKSSSAYVSLNGVCEVASSAPTAATGIVWYDTANGQLKIYNGSSWQAIGDGQIDTSQALSSLLTAQLAQKPNLVLSAINNTAMWNYLLKNSAVRAEIVKHKLYLDTMMGIGSSNLALDTDMEDAILGSIDPLSLALTIPSFWLNSSFLTYWRDNYWTQYNYSGHATTTVESINSKYGFRITCDAHWVTNFPYFSVDMDLTDFDTLSFWYQFSGNTANYCRLYIGSTLENEFNNVESGTYSLDISGYSGVQTVKFQFDAWGTPALTFDFTDLILS